MNESLNFFFFFVVSVTDGFNLPMRITNNKGCTIADCPVDLVPDCPAPLKAFDASGNAIGCKSACEANLDGTPGRLFNHTNFFSTTIANQLELPYQLTLPIAALVAT